MNLQEKVSELKPEIFQNFRHLIATTWETINVNPELLELGRLRSAKLLSCAFEAQLRYHTDSWDGISEERVKRLSAWPTDPEFSDEERAVLEYTEQIVMDPHGVEDDCVDRLRSFFDEQQFVQLTTAIVTIVEMQRLLRFLGPAPEREVVWSDSVRAVQVTDQEV